MNTNTAQAGNPTLNEGAELVALWTAAGPGVVSELCCSLWGYVPELRHGRAANGTTAICTDGEYGQLVRELVRNGYPVDYWGQA